MKKKPPITFALGLLLSATLGAQTDVRVEMQRQEGDVNFTDIRVHFDSEAHRRYIIEVSGDLSLWEPHYLAPFEPSAEGYWVRQLDMSNPYTPKSEFYRASQLPWSFQMIDNSGDWIGDLSLASNGSRVFVIYQNRETNALHYSESDQDGVFGTPSVIQSTGAVDAPGFWDNSGFSDVTLLHYGTVLYLVCTDDIAKKVIMLRKDDNSQVWTRSEISGVIDAHVWAFPKFAISPTGILGVAYAGNEGTLFSYADHAAPVDWRSVLITTAKPNSSFNFKAKFTAGSQANVFINYEGGFRVSTDDGSVSTEDYPEDPPPDLSPEELENMASANRNETQSNAIRLPDDRLVMALSNAWRVIVAIEDQ